MPHTPKDYAYRNKRARPNALARSRICGIQKSDRQDEECDTDFQPQGKTFDTNAPRLDVLFGFGNMKTFSCSRFPA